MAETTGIARCALPDGDREARDALARDGCVVLADLLSGDVLDATRALSERVLGETSAEHRSANRSQGSLVAIADHPGYATLVGHERLGRAFDALGFPDPRFSSGYLIGKPPGGPPLFWHQDWWAWDHEISYADPILQVFVMVYLGETRRGNGCLRVIPGTHRRRHALHEAEEAHGETLSRVDDPDDPLYGAIDGEVDVPVSPGDVIVGDARLLHAAHANGSDAERSLVTLWFHPDWSALPPPLQARVRGFFDREGTDTDRVSGGAPTPADWPDAARLDALFPSPAAAAPHPMVRRADPERMRR